jgi:hypothetical protein
LKRWKKTLPRFGPEPGGRGYRLGLVWPVADSASNCAVLALVGAGMPYRSARVRSGRYGWRVALAVQVQREGVDA